MGKTFHSKYEFKKLAGENRTGAAKALASRHPDGTRAKGLRKDMKGYLDYKQLKDRFGDAYEQSSRLHRMKRWIKHGTRAKGKIHASDILDN